MAAYKSVLCLTEYRYRFLLLTIPQNGLFTKKKTKVTAVSQDHQLSSKCHFVSKRREKISQKSH